MAAQTDWQRVAALYTQLLVRVPSPVVALNRAVAISRAEGPAAGLLLLDELAPDGPEPPIEETRLPRRPGPS